MTTGYFVGIGTVGQRDRVKFNKVRLVVRRADSQGEDGEALPLKNRPLEPMDWMDAT